MNRFISFLILALSMSFFAGCDFSVAVNADQKDTNNENAQQGDGQSEDNSEPTSPEIPTEPGGADGTNGSTPTPTPTPTPTEPEAEPEKTELETALETGDVSAIDSTAPLTDAVTDFLANSEQSQDQTNSNLFNQPNSNDELGSLTWNPTHDAALLVPSPGINFPLLLTNDSGAGASSIAQEPIAISGQTNSSRYIVMGSNPFRNAQRDSESVNEAMHQFMVNGVEWLTGKDVSSVNNVVLAHLDQSYYFPDYEATADWLTQRINADITVTARGDCDDDQLAACLSSPQTELLIISQKENAATDAEQISRTVQAAMASGTPVLYLHHDGGLSSLGKELFKAFDVSYGFDNYWKKLKISNAPVNELKQDVALELGQFKAFFAALENDTWSFDLSSCDDKCENQPEFKTEFLKPAQHIREILSGYDANGRYLFKETGYEFAKYAVLLADKYREDIRYPMDKATTPRAEFMRALFADYAQYQRREFIPVPKDLGNFSRTEFPGVVTTSQSIQIESRQNFKAAGVYALPGKPVTVTRNDDQDTAVYVQVNSIRTGATHLWDEDGFKRPVYLTSKKLKLEAGETLTFTSTYGGPIHLYFNNNERTLDFNFENIALHPYWNGPEDDVSFSQALAADKFDWAELSTPAFEVHSKIDKMRDSATDENWPTGAALAEATMKYTHNYPHVLAGFKGKGIDVVDEIHDFAELHGWTIDTLDKVKHMNADQATCGYGCSGNPYDAYWSFSPTGHGDIHELGHGLEKGRFRFKTKDGGSWEGHATTNPYSYYSKSRFYQETAQAPNCQNLPFDELYVHLQQAQASSNAFNYMADLNLKSWNTSVATYIQFMMAAENQGVLANGWHLWARLHMYEREFSRADNSEELWASKRASLGMPNLNLIEAKALNNNDWMLLALSFITSRDYQPLFNLYGLAVSDVAVTQMNQLAYPVMPAAFYGADKDNYCLGLDKPELPLDGSSVWPY